MFPKSLLAKYSNRTCLLHNPHDINFIFAVSYSYTIKVIVAYCGRKVQGS